MWQRGKKAAERAGEYDDEADDGTPAPLRSDGEGGGGIEANAKNKEGGGALVGWWWRRGSDI